eukprot:jgi/Phyca11/19899/fgenesh1_pg.PHYCAscaffold_53_\
MDSTYVKAQPTESSLPRDRQRRASVRALWRQMGFVKAVTGVLVGGDLDVMMGVVAVVEMAVALFVKRAVAKRHQKSLSWPAVMESTYVKVQPTSTEIRPPHNRHYIDHGNRGQVQ